MHQELTVFFWIEATSANYFPLFLSPPDMSLFVVATPGVDNVADEDWLCVVTEVVIAIPGVDNVADEDWLCLVTEEVAIDTPGADQVADELLTDTEVVAATPGTDDDV